VNEDELAAAIAKFQDDKSQLGADRDAFEAERKAALADIAQAQQNADAALATARQMQADAAALKAQYENKLFQLTALVNA